MKKLTLFASAIVAVLAVSSCSSDMLEENTQQQEVKGKPFVINVANNGETRGEDITAVSKFKLSGTYGTTNWIPNYLFEPSNNAWLATGHTDLTWPTAAQVSGNTHTFYATCDNTDTPPAITNGSFNYTVPAAIADQKDLLVAAVTDAPNETPVVLTFKHALSSVKFKIGFDGSKTSGSTDDMYFAVNKITLYNIATEGSFNFSNIASTPWAVSETPVVNYVIEFKDPFVFTASANNSSFDAVTDAYIDADIYVLPQQVTPWAGNNSTSLSNSYIGVSFQAYDAYDWDSDENQYYDEEEDDDYNYNDQYLSLDGKLDIDHYKNDKFISLYAPKAIAAGCVTLSDLQSRDEDVQYEEVYLPLKMTNGFGFNKTNTLRIAVDQTLRYGSSKYEPVFKALDIVIQ